MRLKVVSLILFFFSLSIYAQEKFLIYFIDKGPSAEASLSKTSNLEVLAKKYLSERSIERRKKTLGESFLLFQDLPINIKYINELQHKDIKIVNKLKWFNAVSAYLDDEQLTFVKSLNYVTKIERVKRYKFSEPRIKRTETPKSLKKTSSVHLYDYGPSLTQNELSDIPDVHDMGITGEGVLIGILDTGFDWETPNSLKNRNVLAEYDFVFKDGETANDAKDVSSQHNHGTSVFSILGGFDEGNIIGPAFNAQFLLAKTEYDPTETHVEEDNYAAALEWMDSIGVDITTSSIGYSYDFELYGEEPYTYEDMDGKTTIVTKAAEMTFDRGIVVITSAGNEGNKSWHFITAPGDGFNTITVGAVSSSNNVAYFSSRGPTFDGRIKPEVVAQGTSVFNASAGSSSSYSFSNGTSVSAPIVAGVTGLLLSAYPHLNNEQVRSILIESGDNVNNPNNDIGYGLISAIRAVTYPNISKIGEKFTLNKMFSSDLNIDETSIKLVLEDSSSFTMIKNPSNIYTLDLDVLPIGENYKFHFSYNDSQNNSFREPVDNQYNLDAGELFIDLFLTDTSQHEQTPTDFFLSQNYPNPFNPDTKIVYSIPESATSSKVELKVYNILGMEVRTLVNTIKEPGNYTVLISSENMASGVYFYRLQVGSFTQTKKMIVLR